MLFAENGIPESLQCDNGTQFTSGEFHQLASQYGFEIVTSSPHYPRGHGFVERQVQTVKKTILKCRETVKVKECTAHVRRWGSSIQKFGFINNVDNVNWPPYRDSKKLTFRALALLQSESRNCGWSNLGTENEFLFI